jgi:hypothetical protein
MPQRIKLTRSILSWDQYHDETVHICVFRFLCLSLYRLCSAGDIPAYNIIYGKTVP